MTLAATPLDGIRVVELGDGWGAHCGRILADLGADVIKVEPPGGDPDRRWPPFIGDRPGPDRSLWWIPLNVNKRSVVLDLASASGRERASALIAGADMVIESFPPGRLAEVGLSYETLAARDPAVILVSITPYGQSGPLADAPASDIEVSAAGGAVWLAGEPGRVPMRSTLPQSPFWAGMYGAMGALFALQARTRTGRGQHVDVSAQAAMVTVIPPAPLFWDILREEHMRTGPYLLGRSRVGSRFRTIYPCADGYVAFAIQGGRPGRHTGRMLTAWMGERGQVTQRFADIDWDTFDQSVLTQEEVDALESGVAAFLLTLSKREFIDGAIERGMLGYVVADTKDLYEDEQLAARRFWQAVPLPDRGGVLFPGGFALFDGERPAVRRPAPQPGEHDAEVLAGAPRARPAARTAPLDGATRALEGLRVIELGKAAAGPLVGKYLANFGAEVIHLESRTAPDVFRTTYPPFKDNVVGEDRAAMFAFYNDGKRSATLNLKHPQGAELARALIAKADVFIESFPGGTLGRLGLDHASLTGANPKLVMLSSCNWGQTGPRAQQAGYGSQLSAQAGFADLLGEPDRVPLILYGPYVDYIGTGYGVIALLAALERRQRTGQGCYVDLSQCEAGLQFLGPALLEYAANGRVPKRQGDRDLEAAPHGVYPCEGLERWVALSVWGDEEWSRFVTAIGSPEWARDARLVTAAGRRACADRCDERIADWTRVRSREDVVATLRRAGLRVAPVNTVSELFSDPQLSARGFFRRLPHPVIGEVSCISSPAMLLGTPSLQERAGPTLGADNDHVFGGILGLSSAEREALARDGVFD